jgi:hypothetical protein
MVIVRGADEKIDVLKYSKVIRQISERKCDIAVAVKED